MDQDLRSKVAMDSAQQAAKKVEEQKPEIAREFHEAKNEIEHMAKALAIAFSADTIQQSHRAAKAVQTQVNRITIRWFHARKAMAQAMKDLTTVVVVPQ